MATSQMSELIRHLRGAASPREGDLPTDGQLLEEYVSRRAEAALEALVRRHGPMVWGVCRRALGSHHDAEEAFQATFLVLVRRASSVRPRGMVSNWLYGVARQTALKARATINARKGRERQVGQMPEPMSAERADWAELQPLLDEELSRLPDRHRAVVVLCDLEGKTRKETARQLGIPEGTVAGWLARGRTTLAKRLAERGVTLSGGALAALIARDVASAGVPDSVIASTLKAAGAFAAGQAAAAGLVSAKAVALSEGVLKAMLVSKLKAVVAVALVLGFMATGAAGLVYHKAVARGDKPPVAEGRVKEPQEPEQDNVAFTAWGKEAGGLQMGLGFRQGERRSYRHGETVTLVVRVRNVSNKEVKFSYFRQFSPNELVPTVTDGGGKQVRVEALTIDIRPRRVERALAPGKEAELSEVKLDLRPASESGNKGDLTLYGEGRFYLQHERMNGMFSPEQVGLDPSLDKLATGKLELEVKAARPEKEAFTAWGEEVGGLQAGLGFLPGQKRVYGYGETITLIVKVRNVGKETVRFEYLKQFLDENPPDVTDAAGKAVPQHRTDVLGIHFPVAVSLEPGKELVLETRMHGASGVSYELRPASGGGKPTTKARPLFAGTGKVVLQYERVLGDTGSGRIKLDPVLSKLATGRLELEVRAGSPLAGKNEVLSPEEAVKLADGSKATVGFKVERVTKSILVKEDGGKDAGWATGHGPDDVCLRPGYSEGRAKSRFVAILTDKAVRQLKRAGITDVEKHLKGKAVRVAGRISWAHYDGWGTPPEAEIVIDDLSQLEVVN